MKLVRDYMKINVISLDPETSIFDAAKIFSEHNISGAPVVENGKVVGVISVTDIVRFMKMKLPKSEIYPESHALALIISNLVKEQIEFRRWIERISQTKVRNLMSTDVISIQPDKSILEAVNIMEKNDVERLPVIEEGKLIGIISRADLIRALID